MSTHQKPDSPGQQPVEYPADPSTRHCSGAVWPLQAEGYRQHFLHHQDRVWPESNCYVDLWIELLHAANLDPVAALAFTLAVDFEGDQWTFFKFPLRDLHDLFGLQIQELSLWKGPAVHVAEQVAMGRVVLLEVNSYFLPDLAGTSYHTEHGKTTIAIQAIDQGALTCGYFHGAGYFQLAGDDYRGLFRVDDPWTTQNIRLLPYAELVKVDRLVHRSPADLKAGAVAQLRAHLQERPARNPFVRYRERLAADLEWLKGEPIGAFHLYAFSSVRQLGSAFELGSTFLRWLESQGESGLTGAADALLELATTAKTLQFKLARAVNGKKAFDPAPSLDEMGRRWESAMDVLLARYGR